MKDGFLWVRQACSIDLCVSEDTGLSVFVSIWGETWVCVYSVMCMCVDKLWCLGVSGERERHVCIYLWRAECIWEVQERQVNVCV